jgi:hypothetical protein
VSGSIVRFCVAGLDVVLRSAQPDGLAMLGGYYDAYPSAGKPPGLELEIERVRGLAAGREPGPSYPAFERQLGADGRIELLRYDAEGEIRLPPPGAGTYGPAAPVRGRFRVEDGANSLEAAIRIGVSIALPRRGAMILHASAVVAEGRAHVFAGVSGAGKSTIATMLADACPAVYKVSDELLIAAPAQRDERADDTGWCAHVTPFIGSGGLSHRTYHPIAGIHFLVQAASHQRSPMSRADGLRELMHHVLVYVAEPDTAGRVLSAAMALTAAVPCDRLAFAKNPGVATVLGITCE